MSHQDELFQLVKSLTPSEKRYFKVNGDSKSNYMQLFEAMDAQKEEYDEEKLKKKNAKKPFVKYLSAEKKQLREQILKYMRGYHSTRSVDNQINELLQDERFYRDKGLNDIREKTILKAKELATKYERFHLLKEILVRHLNYTIEFEQKKLTEPVLDIINEQKQLALTESALLELITKNQELFAIYRSGADIQDRQVDSRTNMLISEVEIYRPRVNRWFQLATTYNRAYANFYQIHRDWKSSFTHTKLEYELYQSHQHFIEEDSYGYKLCIANLMSRAHSAQENEWFIKALEEMKTLPVHSFNEEGEVFQNVYFLEHLHYINAGEFEKAVALISAIEEGLEKYATKVNKARKLAFQFNIMIMYFLMHEFKEALKWCDLLLADNSEIKQHQKFVTILLLPLIHFELGHDDLVESYTRSAYRYLQKKSRLHEFERAVLKYLKEMPLSSDTINFIDKLSMFHQEIEELYNNPKVKVTLGMEEMSLWAKSHLNGTKMSELLRTA